jgi:hypothetical protein
MKPGFAADAREARKTSRLIHRALNERRALRHDTHVGIGLGLTGSLEIDIDDDRL